MIKLLLFINPSTSARYHISNYRLSFLMLFVLMDLGCSLESSNDFFLTKCPEKSELFGVWSLDKGNSTWSVVKLSDGISDKEKCELILKPDGKFEISNMPSETTGFFMEKEARKNKKGNWFSEKSNQLHNFPAIVFNIDEINKDSQYTFLTIAHFRKKNNKIILQFFVRDPDSDIYVAFSKKSG